MVLTDFVFALAKFALYFYLLLFNCQVSIAHLLCVSLSIISLSSTFVNRFLKSFFKIFLTRFGVIFAIVSRRLCYFTTFVLICQEFFSIFFDFGVFLITDKTPGGFLCTFANLVCLTLVNVTLFCVLCHDFSPFPTQNGYFA